MFYDKKRKIYIMSEEEQYSSEYDWCDEENLCYTVEGPIPYTAIEIVTEGQYKMMEKIKNFLEKGEKDGRFKR